jgi:hypothetical protein
MEFIMRYLLQHESPALTEASLNPLHHARSGEMLQELTEFDQSTMKSARRQVADARPDANKVAEQLQFPTT